MTHSRVSLDDIEPRELDGIEPTLLSVGYELRPAEMRPNVWRFAAGEATNDHRHEAQEELYVVLEGRFEVTVEGGADGGAAGDGDGDTGDGGGNDGAAGGDDDGDAGDVTATDRFELGIGDYLVVPPESWRRLTAVEDSLLLVVGAPPVEDDDVRR